MQKIMEMEWAVKYAWGVWKWYRYRKLAVKKDHLRDYIIPKIVLTYVTFCRHIFLSFFFPYITA